MNLTTKEWRKEISLLSDTDLNKFTSALVNLKNFEPLVEQFQWTGLFIIKDLLRDEQNKRNMKIEPIEEEDTTTL